MPGLGEMLQGGPEGLGLSPQAGPDDGEMGPAPQEGMSPEDAMGVLQQHRIGPDEFPQVAEAVMTILQMSQQGGGQEPPPEEGPPPGGPGGPPPM